MPVLDFKEIPEAHLSSGLQDTFELFARDFLSFIGYKVLTDPDRGADGGVDLIVEERRTGVGGETLIRWLVSCKHKTYSGKSVSTQDDFNIRDRLDANNCKGFIGFYSTLASSGLSRTLEGMSDKFDCHIFDKEKIESKLLSSSKGLEIAARYFPKSIEEFKIENPRPAELFIEKPTLKCCFCDKELLDQEDKGVIQLWYETNDDAARDYYKYVVWACRGFCDDQLVKSIRRKDENVMDGWEDISDVMIPTIFIKWILTIINQNDKGVKYSDDAVEKLKYFIVNVYPYVSRHLTSKEKERVYQSTMIPSYLGGLGT